ncbi:MAG: cysteine-rich CWC family protein [Acidobacteriota bacterium]
MKLFGILRSNLPVLRKTQACEACGASFGCEISPGQACWCGEVKLSDKTRQELRAKYRNCLCRTCLENAEATYSRSEADANAGD